MRKFIVSTTINPPTEAIKRFDSMDEWELIVVGDLKTPNDYKLSNGTYVSPKEQEDRFPKLSAAIGWNCIQRRNLGFLVALAEGADIIASVDDDNIPLEGWGLNLMIGKQIEVDIFESEDGVVDPISVAGESNIWHRGFPLEYLSNRRNIVSSKEVITPDVQADFWNGDPDVDAISRLEHAPEVVFNPSRFPFSVIGMAPFNSQNTFFSRKAVSEYFLLPNVGRMDDIWAGYYLQSRGYRVVYGAASVYQMRNPHNLLRDFEGEIGGYLRSGEIIRELKRDSNALKKYLPGNTIYAWETYKEELAKIG